MRPELPVLKWWVIWIGVFAANLIVPLWRGWGVVEERGAIGMCLGIGSCFFVATYAAIERYEWLRFALPFGGTIVAASQIFPVLQMIAGFAGLLVASLLGQADRELLSVTSELGGFAVTIVTGGLLLTAAFGIGGPVYLIRDELRASREQAKSHEKPAAIIGDEV